MLYLIVQISIIFDIDLFLQLSMEEPKSDCDKQAKSLSSEIQGFELIHKTPHEESTEIITITSCWITDTSIQVGKSITFNANVTSSRYTENITHYKNITIKFHYDDINYWNVSYYLNQSKYKMSNELTLYIDDSKISLQTILLISDSQYLIT